MPVLGLVLQFADGADLPEPWCTDDRLTLGARDGGRQAAVLETRARREDRDALEALRSCPCILDVQVAFADFSDFSEVSP